MTALAGVGALALGPQKSVENLLVGVRLLRTRLAVGDYWPTSVSTGPPSNS